MGLDITCVNACAEQQSNATCEAFAGCRWLPAKAECVSAEDASGKSTLWIGVVLSLVAGQHADACTAAPFLPDQCALVPAPLPFDAPLGARARARTAAMRCDPTARHACETRRA